MYKRILKIALLVLFTGKIYSQQVVTTAGGEGSLNGINLQWTLGECVIAESEIQNTVILTQGFQQPAYAIEPEIDTTNISSGIQFTGNIQVFPVPASDYITIDCKIDQVDAITVVLTDINSKSLIKRELFGEVNQLDMQALSSGIYLLTITSRQGNFIKSFEITKQ